MIDPVTGLPAYLVSSISTGAIGAVVSGLLSLFAPVLLQVPGLRANDSSRNTYMRALIFVLTLLGLVGLAASQGIALPVSMWPGLLLLAGGGTAFAHLIYAGAKSSGSGGALVGSAQLGVVTPLQSSALNVIEGEPLVGGPVVPFSAPVPAAVAEPVAAPVAPETPAAPIAQ